jgi:hypothetical protein
MSICFRSSSDQRFEWPELQDEDSNEFGDDGKSNEQSNHETDKVQRLASVIEDEHCTELLGGHKRINESPHSVMALFMPGVQVV